MENNPEFFEPIDTIIQIDAFSRFIIIKILKPFMLENLFGINSAPAVETDSFGNQVLGFWADLLPLLALHLVVAQNDLLEYFIVIVAVEGGVPAQHYVEDYACRPDVAFGVVGAH